jgi:predicted homoserine dehydrogenase-like protein
LIIVDTALRKRAAENRPVRVAMVGAGFMARGIANQIINSVPGMKLVAMANRTPANGVRAYVEAGVAAEDVRVVEDVSGLDDAIASGAYAVTTDSQVVCRADGVDAILEVTGAIEFGARVALDAIANGKHFVTMNAELDGTAGPILKRYADRAGVVYSGTDGDQPGVQMNLYRYVRSIGLVPLVCGNVKGLQDAYRTPTTQAGFAQRWGQDPYMVTSFADGTKISFEQAVVANATGMTIARRGMLGRTHTGHVDELTASYDAADLKRLGGVVDYVVGAKPAPGVFVLASLPGDAPDAMQKHLLNYYKLGEGPLYSFYTPYHLCHLEVPLSVARVVLFDDAVIQPLAGPRVEVITTAKTDLRAGDRLDGLGGYKTYGQCETATATAAARLLPIGVAEGCTLTRDVPKDAVLTYADVELPEGRLIDQLRAEQDAAFLPAVAGSGSARVE